MTNTSIHARTTVNGLRGRSHLQDLAGLAHQFGAPISVTFREEVATVQEGAVTMYTMSEEQVADVVIDSTGDSPSEALAALVAVVSKATGYKASALLVDVGDYMREWNIA